MGASARVRKGDERRSARPTPKITPARTTEEIIGRLFGVCERIDARLNKGRPLTIEEMRAISKRIRSYAIRLRDAGTKFELY